MAITNIEDRLFGLHTKNTSYIIRISETGLLENIHWGKRLNDMSDFLDMTSGNPTVFVHSPVQLREECSSYGTMQYKESSLMVQFADGVRDFRYLFAGCQIDEQHLEIILEDIHYPFSIHLHYEIFEEEDIIKKWRVVKNKGTCPIVLNRIYSGEFGLPGTGYESINYRGRWAAEYQIHSEPVDAGKKVYESMYGFTSHTVSPFFMVHNKANETSGEVWYGTLEYSGNFKTVVEAVSPGFTNILIGISDTDFAWTLQEGELFQTPAVYCGYSSMGFESMTHTIIGFAHNHLMPKPMANKALPVLYNSWYATNFDVNCEDQIKLAERAAKLGVELFVVDDGWFAGRKDDTAGLGDWYVDREKLPEGLKPLIEKVNALGMKFGLWIEPEMVNPKSKLYKEHPDWIYQYPTREVLMGRNQYELDMANPKVVDYLIETLDALLSENNIEYIKWDMNRYGAERGSTTRKPEQWRELQVRNTEGIYRLIKELRKRHPMVEFEACAGGGGRVDYGTLRYFDEYWTSDNTDALDRLYIQESYSYLYPIKYMRAWLTDDYHMNQRKIPLSFTMHSVMCGAMGIGTNLNQTSKEQLSEIKHYIEEYKEIRDIVQFGKVYRLQSFVDSAIHVVQYVKEERSVIFAFLDHERYGNTQYYVKMRGLNEDKRYYYVLDGKRIEKTGAFLMEIGMELRLKGDYDSCMIKLTTIK